jgi:hypothetical protein
MRAQFGEKMFLGREENLFHLPFDQWVELSLKIEMNDPGMENGTLECRVDDELLLQKKNMVFRHSADLAVDHLLFSTFFGGSDRLWAPTDECELYFKDIVVTGGFMHK